jgi:hypothetical protein
MNRKATLVSLILICSGFHNSNASSLASDIDFRVERSQLFPPASDLVRHRTEIVVPIRVVTPPRREGVGRTSRTEHRKGKNKQHSQTSTIKGTGNQVRIVLEDARAVVAEVVLDIETGEDPAEDNTGLALVVRDVASILDELGHIDIGNVETADFGNELGTWVSYLIEKVHRGYLLGKKCDGR